MYCINKERNEIKMAQNDIYAEPAEQARNEATNKLLAKQNDVTLASLKGNYLLISDITDYGDLFNDKGDQALAFHVDNDGNIYEVDLKKFSKTSDDNNKLVVELDADNTKINWLQDHVEQQPFETFNSLRSSKYVGDAGYPLIQALEAYVHGTYNISGYDTRLVTKAELVNDLIKPADVNNPETAAPAKSPNTGATSAASSAPKSAASSTPKSSSPAPKGDKGDSGK